MARYRFERGDDREMRRYVYAQWREFAERPEVGSASATLRTEWSGASTDRVLESFPSLESQANAGRLDLYPAT